MVIGVLRLSLMLSATQSLKEKRMILNRVKDHIHHTFRVAVAEVDAQDTWQRAVLGVAAVGTDRASVNSRLSRVADAVGRMRDVELLEDGLELLSV